MPRTKFVTASTNADGCVSLTFPDPTGSDKPDAIKILEPMWVKFDRPPGPANNSLIGAETNKNIV
jgi:hypothetical protein